VARLSEGVADGEVVAGAAVDVCEGVDVELEVDVEPVLEDAGVSVLVVLGDVELGVDVEFGVTAAD